MAIMKEFREFAVKGNVIDLAVGVIIGAAFGAIVKSLVDDIIMPPIGVLLGGVDFKNRYHTVHKDNATLPADAPLDQARAGGEVVIAYGQFINNIITFLIVAFAVFMMVKQINRLRRSKKTQPVEPTEKVCPYCFSKVPVQATKCAHCTSALQAQGPSTVA
ncbi:MAG TPA: large conductance mechanosensitive channel protein MscL [Candidatus Thermoplasmatota archaeon]|nr:large conductance mechanosensitive channel protein MscL [Candidatus Thermoplasmatota archaeon]